MKILFVSPSFFPATAYGGPIFSALNTCNYLSQIADIDLRVSTTNANKGKLLNIRTNCWLTAEFDFKIKYYKETKVDKFSYSMFKGLIFDIRNTEVVYAQSIFSASTPLTLLYSFMFNKNVLISPRGSFSNWALNYGSRFKNVWLSLLIKPFSNSILWHATSEFEKEDILKIFPKARVVVIPNGIDLKIFDNINKLGRELYCEKFINKDISPEKIIVSMGRLHKVKGFDILIQSFSIVLEKYPNSILCIAGKDDGELDNLSELVKSLGLENKVFFIGEIYGQDKYDFLSNADVFALPSHTENFGNVYLESLSVGTPIVASHGTPWSEVEDNNCGRWVENSTNNIAEATLDLLGQDRNLLKENSVKYSRQFSWLSISEKFYQAFLRMSTK